MKEHLNTLFVTTHGSYLAKDGETVLVRVDDAVKLRVPVHTLAGIMCFGKVGCSPALLRLCGERDVTVSFLSSAGTFWGRVEGPVSGNVLLRRQQYRWADSDKQSAAVAYACILAKVANCRAVLQRALRDRPDALGAAELSSAAEGLQRRLNSV